jgi:ferredoxin/Pyruvate/2-oxoacid:ferredoxin oxidoreductase gamma subunit
MSTEHVGLKATTGRQAISLVEGRVCASAIALQPTVAEGMAASGQRAAALPSAAPLSDPVAVPLVVHRVSNTLTGWGSFELRGSSAQEAAEHCLVARWLTERLRAPGLCGLHPEVADEIGLVRLPTDAQLQSALGSQADLTRDPRPLLDVASEAFDVVAKALGRTCQAWGSYELHDAEVVVVGLDAGRPKVRAAIDALRTRGARVGALWPRLVRPFPEAQIREALAGRTALLTRDLATSSISARVDSKHTIPTQGSLAEIVRSLASHLEVDGAHASDTGSAPQVTGAPCSPWGEGILRDAAALAGWLVPLRLGAGSRLRGAASVAWAPLGSEGALQKGLDTLLSPHPGWLDPQGLLRAVREGGRVILNASAEVGAELWWAGLAEAQRVHITRRRLRLVWIDAEACARQAGHAELASWALLGAFFAQKDAIHGVEAAASGLEERLEADGLSAEAEVLRAGAAQARALDPIALEAERPIQELDFRPKSALPLLPEPPRESGQGGDLWRTRILRFHATGGSEALGAHAAPLRPALMAALLGDERPSSFPLLLSEGEAPRAIPLRVALEEACGATGLSGRALRDNLARLELSIDAELGVGDPRSTGEICEAAGAAMAKSLGLGSADDAALGTDLARLAQALPPGRLVSLGKHTPLALHLAAQRAGRHETLTNFRAELQALAARLEELRILDHQSSPGGRDAGALSRSLGGALNLLDPTALAKRLGGVPAANPLDAGRRERITAAATEIRAYLEDPPGWMLVNAPGLPTRAFDALKTDAPSARFERVDPCALAQGVFDGLALRTTRLLRAMRVARLEIEHGYLPELHDEALNALSWESFSAAELAVIPPVVVVTGSAQLRDTGLASLLTLLRSGRPVRVLVILDSGARDDVRALDLAYQALGVREAGVLQSSLAQPTQLLEGLERQAQSTRPSVAFVEQPRWLGAAWPQLWASALLEGREVSALRYDPSAGETWAERLELMAPQGEVSWPNHSLRYQDESGAEASMALAFTFAHVAALVPALRRHLWPIPREAWADDQRPVAEFLASFDPSAAGPPTTVPYLWVVDSNARLQRAVISHELAFACRERARLWRVLQELGGVRNEHALRAAQAARQEAISEAEVSRAELLADHARELTDIREAATRDAVDYLVGALLDPGSVQNVAGSRPAPAAPMRAASPAPTAAVATIAEGPETEPQPAEEEISFEEAFVDTPMCTTCNECTNLNGRMFRYDGNKQAYLADLSAGTFRELVEAAELCPVSIIHPGKPQAGDDSVTDELLERAAVFG